jgi:release factor glutamine methyltransferase
LSASGPLTRLSAATDVGVAVLAGAAALGDGGRFESELLLGEVLGLDRIGLLRERSRALAPSELARFEALLAARLGGTPVAYLLGRREFWSMSFLVDQRVLIPRPETEVLVELARALLADAPAGPVLDLGTGSGAVAIALAVECETREIFAVDRSAAALAVARRNVERLVPGRVRLILGNWLDAIAATRVAVVVSNPPYVEDGYPGLATGELRHEPRAALAAGPTGLDALTAIVRGARHRLIAGGWLALEHGAGQGAAVRELLDGAGFEDIATRRDLADLERVSYGRKPAAGD